MTDNTHQLARVWTWDKSADGTLADINRPVSSPTHEKALPVGRHPLRLHSLGTPSDQKVTVMLEELLMLGVTDTGYNVWLIRTGDGDQSSSGFVEMNPNSETPALRDHTHNPLIRVFESSSILLHLAEKLSYFLLQDPAKRTETMNWLFWLQGVAPFLDGGFSRFYHYAPVKIEYAISRFTIRAKHLPDALDKQLAQHKSVAGDEYIVADMAIWPWFGNAVLDNVYDTAKFPDAGSYKHIQRQAKGVGERPAVKHGRIVNRINGPSNERLRGRHDASDFETNTEDKRQG